MKPLNPILHQEQKHIFLGFTAFAVAIMFLIIQGSVNPETVMGVLGAGLLAASIPTSIFSYLLSLKALASEDLCESVQKRVENVLGFSFALTAVGFGCLLFESNWVLFFVIVLSATFSSLYVSRIIRAWDDGKLGKDDVQDKEEVV